MEQWEAGVKTAQVDALAAAIRNCDALIDGLRQTAAMVSSRVVKRQLRDQIDGALACRNCIQSVLMAREELP